MTKSQIKAELRRSACEDENPWRDTNYSAATAIVEFSDWPSRGVFWENVDDCRTFFLLVAEAL